jgi:AP-1 complex subunit gamma-1
VEYNQLFQTGHSIRTGLLERMPVIEKATSNGTSGSTPVTNGNGGLVGENEEDLLESGGTDNMLSSKLRNNKQPQPETQNILDLLDTTASITSPPASTNAINVGGGSKSAGGDLLDLLGDLDMGGGSNGAPNPPPGGGMLLDGLGGGGLKMEQLLLRSLASSHMTRTA